MCPALVKTKKPMIVRRAALHFESLCPTGERDLGHVGPAQQRPELILMIHRKAAQLV